MKEDASGKIKIAEKIKSDAAGSALDTQDCKHISTIQDVSPSAGGCERCLLMGDEWVNLRLCLTCGHVGCCDNSKNKHATKHYRETNHPMIVSYELGEDWLWCYADQIMIQP